MVFHCNFFDFNVNFPFSILMLHWEASGQICLVDWFVICTQKKKEKWKIEWKSNKEKCMKNSSENIFSIFFFQCFSSILFFIFLSTEQLHVFVGIYRRINSNVIAQLHLFTMQYRNCHKWRGKLLSHKWKYFMKCHFHKHSYKILGCTTFPGWKRRVSPPHLLPPNIQYIYIYIYIYLYIIL